MCATHARVYVTIVEGSGGSSEKETCVCVATMHAYVTRGARACIRRQSANQHRRKNRPPWGVLHVPEPVPKIKCSVAGKPKRQGGQEKSPHLRTRKRIRTRTRTRTHAEAHTQTDTDKDENPQTYGSIRQGAVLDTRVRYVRCNRLHDLLHAATATVTWSGVYSSRYQKLDKQPLNAALTVVSKHDSKSSTKGQL